MKVRASSDGADRRLITFFESENSPMVPFCGPLGLVMLRKLACQYVDGCLQYVDGLLAYCEQLLNMIQFKLIKVNVKRNRAREETQMNLWDEFIYLEITGLKLLHQGGFRNGSQKR